MAVGALRMLCERAAVAGFDRLDGRARTPDRGLRKLRGMGIADGIVHDGAQPKALGRVERCALEMTVIVGERFRLAVLEVELPVIGVLERFVDNTLDAPAIEAGAVEENVLGD